MKLETLDTLNDEELQAVIEQARGLLKHRDDDRKANALEQAKALLASVGLGLKDLNRAKGKTAKGLTYKGGHSYQHPANKGLIWAAKGKKPGWLVELEAQGGKAVDITPANDNGVTANDNRPQKLKNAV